MEHKDFNQEEFDKVREIMSITHENQKGITLQHKEDLELKLLELFNEFAKTQDRLDYIEVKLNILPRVTACSTIQITNVDIILT